MRPNVRSKLAMLAAAAVTLALQAPAGAQPLAQKRAEVRQRVVEWGMQQLVQRLQLDASQVPRFREIWLRYEQQLQGVNKETSMAMRELKAQLAAATPDEPRLRQLADQVVASRQKAQQLESQRTAELRSLFSATQFARGVVVAPELRKELHEQMQKALQGGGGDE
jgi:Spy/CpxP family protein refolding chaperone